MTLTKSEMATYLFTASLPKSKTRPLTIIEWNILVRSLTEKQMTPENILHLTEQDVSALLIEGTETQRARILHKIEARKQLGLATVEVEELFNQGYRVIFRAQMPKRLKKLELKKRPAFYYSVGNLEILNGKYILGVVGARDATNDELNQVKMICEQAAEENIVVVSGGARGIDSVATTATLEKGGRAIVFPSTGLAAFIRDKSNREYIQNGQLLVLSTEPIHARFSGRYAMQRNKYIHSAADAVLVGSSKISKDKKSGTWEGVLENLQASWSPLYTIGESEGVKKLLQSKEAKPFTTLYEMFHQSCRELDDFEDRLRALITTSRNSGLQLNDMIHKLENQLHFLHQMERNREELSNQSAHSKELEVEQLKLDLVKEK